MSLLISSVSSQPCDFEVSCDGRANAQARGATPRPKSGAEARRTPCSKGGGQEELPHVRGQGRRPGGDTPMPQARGQGRRAGGRSYPTPLSPRPGGTGRRSYPTPPRPRPGAVAGRTTPRPRSRGCAGAEGPRGAIPR